MRIAFLFLLLAGPGFAAPEFQNPGFETPNTAGTGPAAWVPLNQPVWTDQPGDVYAGSRAALTTSFHQYAQQIDGVPARTHVTFAAHVRATEGPARFGPYASFTPATVEPHWFTRNLSIDDAYSSRAVPIAVPPGSTAGYFYPRSSWSEEWIDADDVSLLVEQTTNGGFEPPATPSAGSEPSSTTATTVEVLPQTPSGWERVGGGSWDSSGGQSHSGVGAVRCGVGSGWTQTWSAMEDGQTYALSFWARADTTPGTATLSFQWLDTNLHVIRSEPLSFQADLGWRPWAFFLTPPQGSDVAAARFRLVLDPSSFTDAIWADDVTWGWVGLYPDNFSPNGDGLWDTSEIDAWWPTDQHLVPSGEIQSGDGLTTAPLDFGPAPDGGAGLWSVTWNGLDASGSPAPAGDYTVMVHLPLDSSGTAADCIGSLTLRREPVYPAEQPPYQQTEPFMGGIWLFLGGPWVDADYNQIFRLVQSDGFRYAIAFPPPGRYAECVHAAGDHKVKIILNFWETGETITRYWSNWDLTEDDVRSLLEDKIKESDGLSSPVIGFYLVDEPRYPLHAERASWFMRVLAGLPSPKPGFTTIGIGAGRDQWLTTIRPAVAMFDDYPLMESTLDLSQTLLDYAHRVESLVAEADALDLPCWIVGQGISTVGGRQPPGPGGMRALVWLSVAAGARGFYPFLYLSTGNLEGLRGFDLSPRPRLAVLRQTYRDINALGSLLVDYRPDPSPLPPPSSGHVYVRLWSRPDNPQDRLLWVVNLDLDSTRTIRIELQPSAGSGATTQTLSRVLAPGAGTPVAIPPGETVVNVLTILPPTLPNPLMMSLPVLADSPVPSTLTVNHLDTDSLGHFLAVSCAENGNAGGGEYILDTTQPSDPFVNERVFTWDAEAAAFNEAGDSVAVCDSLRGLDVEDVGGGVLFSIIPFGAQFATPRWEWTAVSGNAHDAVSDGLGGWWVASGAFALRHLVTSGTLTGSGELEQIQRFDTRGNGDRLAWIPPCSDQSGATGPSIPLLALLDEYAGIDTFEIAPDGTADQVGFVPEFRGGEWTAWNGHLAVARREYGIDLYSVCDSTTPTLVSHITALSTVRDVALWQGRVLVAADGREAIRFFDVFDPTRPRELARVRPWVDSRPFFTAVAAAPHWIAVAGEGMGVRFLDPLPLYTRFSPRAWVLY